MLAFILVFKRTVVFSIGISAGSDVNCEGLEILKHPSAILNIRNASTARCSPPSPSTLGLEIFLALTDPVQVGFHVSLLFDDVRGPSC